MLRTRVYTDQQTLLLRSRVCWTISALRAGNSNRFNTSGRGVMLIIDTHCVVIVRVIHNVSKLWEKGDVKEEKTPISFDSR